MDKLFGFVSGIGFLGGMFLGAFLYPSMGVVGCLAAVVCGGFCAVGLPAGLCLLALLGYGLYKAYEKCTKPTLKDEQPKQEPAPVATCNPNAQGAKLVSSLTPAQTLSPKTLSDQATPLLATEKTPSAATTTVEQPGMFNRLLSLFGWHRYASVDAAPVENLRKGLSR